MSREPTLLHKDRHLVCVDKAPGILSVPAPGRTRTAVSSLLRTAFGEIHPVHRLDAETSGVLIFARDAITRDALREQFATRRVKKVYVALVQGRPHPAKGTLEFSIEDLGATARVSARGKPASTEYEVIEDLGLCSIVRVRPRTGRHNQIRLHFAHIGHPLVGERKYAVGRLAVVRHRRVLLHAESLCFRPPHLQHDLRIRAPLPNDFTEVIERIRRAPSPRRPASQRDLSEARRARRRPNRH